MVKIVPLSQAQKLLKPSFFLMLLFVSSTSLASPGGNKFLHDFNRRYEFGVAASSFSYTQNGLLPYVDTQKGVMPGLKFAVSTIDGGQYFAFDTLYFKGDTRFQGHYNDSGVSIPEAFNHSGDLLFIQGRLGQPISIFSSQMLIPYIQVGYYMWNRTLEAPPTHKGANARENYNQFDVSAGLRYDIELNEHWMFEAYGAVGRSLGPSLDVSVDGETNSPSFSLGSNTIVQYGATSYYRLHKDLDLELGYKVETFRYNNSSALVPDNTVPYALTGVGSTIFIWTATLGLSWRFSL